MFVRPNISVDYSLICPKPKHQSFGYRAKQSKLKGRAAEPVADVVAAVCHEIRDVPIERLNQVNFCPTLSLQPSLIFVPSSAVYQANTASLPVYLFVFVCVFVLVLSHCFGGLECTALIQTHQWSGTPLIQHTN
jgi:hypothetical protein